MFFYEGYRCPVCNHLFTPNDDIVTCPDCGLPHHRACWVQEGHCHLSHLHGTSEQWKRDNLQNDPADGEKRSSSNAKICPQCGTKNPEYSEYCRHCGKALSSTDWSSTSAGKVYSEYQPFRSDYNSSSRYSTEKIDGVAVSELSSVVGNRAEQYYLPRFKRISQGHGGGFNWMALLFSPYWMLYRKMYFGGTLLLLLQGFQTILTTIVANHLGLETYEQFFEIEKMLSDRSNLFFFLSFYIFSVIMLMIRLIVGFFGNRIYKQHCVNIISRAKETTPDISASELSAFGGTSFGVTVIGGIAYYVLMELIIFFL